MMNRRRAPSRCSRFGFFRVSTCGSGSSWTAWPSGSVCLVAGVGCGAVVRVSRRSGAPGVGWAGLIGGSAATSGVVCGKGLCSVLVARIL